jgi:hypothetical protein
MNTNKEIAPQPLRSIYTLAQSGTQKTNPITSTAIVSGEGTDILGNTSLAKRAKRKTITRKMILSLVDIAKEKGDKEREKAYWNSYHCQSNIVSYNNKLYGNYCKNRFCTICCAIRKADIINRYYPTLSKWEDTHFITLTTKAIKAHNLEKWIKGMYKAFDRIHNRCKTRYKRGKGIKLVGIKSLECNFNPITQTYNPHFHIIVPSKEIANLLKKEWLFQWKPKDKSLYRYTFTSPKAQHIRAVEDLEHDLIEIIKYGSKIFTEPDLKKKSNKIIPPTIYAYALDNILSAMKGHRLFDRFGFHLPKQPQKENTTKLITNYDKWVFSSTSTDWINPKTGECLTGYLQPLELSFLLNECIDKSLY